MECILYEHGQKETNYINKSICASIVNAQKSLFCLAKDIFSILLYLYLFFDVWSIASKIGLIKSKSCAAMWSHTYSFEEFGNKLEFLFCALQSLIQGSMENVIPFLFDRNLRCTLILWCLETILYSLLYHFCL